MGKTIAGIQQIGIGVTDARQAFKWYSKYFGADIQIFADEAEANLMQKYTGGKPHKRLAILAMNLQSGGGFEIWEYTSRKSQPAAFDLQLGDLGIFVTKIKCKNVKKLFDLYKEENLNLLGDISKTPDGKNHFFLKDPYGNLFEIVEGYGWFKDEKRLTGSNFGCVIGVSDIEQSMKLYSDILGYDTVIFDETGVFDDYNVISGGKNKFRRVLLKHSQSRKGPFSKLFGPSEIELVQVLDRQPEKIYKNRYWGDQGFIHLCFDINGMDALQKECESKGFPFTVDSSNTFDMGEAGGHFSYIEDPDGTLIEFVETHRVPVLKKLGLYLNLKKRNPEKALPNWIVKSLAFNRVKA